MLHFCSNVWFSLLSKVTLLEYPSFLTSLWYWNYVHGSIWISIMLSFCELHWNLYLRFSHVLYSFFRVLAKVPYTHCINYAVLVFLNLEFYPHLVDENSVPTGSLYPDLVFTQNLKAIIFPALVYALYCYLHLIC
jgi:hypothetical protein